MADLQFETNPNEFGAPPQAPQGTDITGKLVQWGLAGNRQQAEYILIAVAVIALLIAGYFIFAGGGSSSVPDRPIYSNGQQ